MTEALIIGIASLSLLVFLRMGRYAIPFGKAIIICLCMVTLGLFMTRVMYFIETGAWDGRSFFGAVLFLPLCFWPISRLLRVPYGAAMDLISLPGLAMFSVLKYTCYLAGCCGGIVIAYTEANTPIFFPSQVVEAVVTVVIVLALLAVEIWGRTKDRLYPLCLIVYGTARFVLNWFRWDESMHILGLPKGNFWALLSIVIGVLWIYHQISAAKEQKKKAE